MPSYKMIETRTVVHTYTWEVEANSSEEAIELSGAEPMPDDAKHETRTIGCSAYVECVHQNQYVSDRNISVCKDCNEELGR
jgi:hypothetical protein